MLELQDVSVFYGDVQAVFGASLRVEEGQIVSVVGSNGAGKTTLINAISGLATVRGGSIKFLGRDIAGMPAFKIVDLGVSQVPEGRRLFPYMTVLENLEVGSYTKRSRAQRSRSLEWVFSLFPRLAERKAQIAGTLSGGEQQMLAIGRSLMSLPRLLMLDEPSLGLAPIIVDKVFEVIGQIRKTGVTLLLVEQNVGRALEMADYAYVIENGRIAMSGAGRELLNNPSLKAAYLGL